MSDKINEYKKKLKESQGKERVDILNQLSELYLNSSPEKSLKYSNQAFQLSEELKDKDKMVESLNKVGSSYMALSNYTKALEFYGRIIQLCSGANDSICMGDSFNKIGNIYWYMGNYEQSLEYYVKALKIREERGDEIGLYRSYNNIGMIYWIQKNYDTALEYYEKCLEKAKNFGEEEMATPINNIGIVYSSWGNYEKALGYYLEALKIYEKMGDKSNTANSFSNLGETYEKIGDNEKSLKYYHKALEMKEMIKDKWGIANVCNKMGGVYIKLKRLEEAALYVNRALDLAHEIGARSLLTDNYSILSDLYLSKGDYKQALEYYKRFSELKDKVFNAQMSEKIAELENKYESERKDREMAELKFRFINMVSHEFRTPLTVIFSTSQALTMCYEKLSAEKRGEKIQNMRGAMSYMTRLLDDILIVGKMYSGKLEPNPEKFNIRHFFNDIIEDFEFNNEKRQSLVFWCDNLDFNLFMDEMLLRKIVTNLLSNAVKYSPEESNIELSVKIRNDNTLLITIKDEGIGIPESDQKYIFEPFYLGSNAFMNQGMGMGLAIVSQAVVALNGEITFETVMGMGTKFMITLPLSTYKNGE